MTIIGIGADGIAGLSAASQAALDAAEVIMAPPRHLEMIGTVTAETIAWPVPFADGLPLLTGMRGRRVVVLVSGDPFWYGAGTAISKSLPADEWFALPAPSTFALAASRMGWALQDTLCIGLHAAPFERLRPRLAPGLRAIVLLRDGDAPHALAAYLEAQGFGDSAITVLEALGGPQERATPGTAATLAGVFEHPVCVALQVSGDGPALTAATGQADAIFDSDGQITKRPIRAITLSTLAPKPVEHLWDIGGGSGSIALEWLMAHETTTATCVELRADRADTIHANAATFGVAHRQAEIEGRAPDVLEGLTPPQAIFVGGGASAALMARVLEEDQARIVANAVTLEGEALLTQCRADHGGDLMRIELAQAAPLGA